MRPPTLADPAMLRVSIDAEREEARVAGGPPPAPKRRRGPSSSRADRLEGFACAARCPSVASMAVTLISSAFRGHQVRTFIATTRPGTASSTVSASTFEEEPDEVPEEIEPDERQCREQLHALSIMKTAVRLSPVDSALLETSGELESSNESFEIHEERTCAVCLGPMSRRRHCTPDGTLRAKEQPLSPTAGRAMTTLECGHQFHRKCLLGWCLHRPPGGCPLCREHVCVRRRRSGLTSTTDGNE